MTAQDAKRRKLEQVLARIDTDDERNTDREFARSLIRELEKDGIDVPLPPMLARQHATKNATSQTVADVRAAAAYPSVQIIRERVFGRSDPPFKDMRDRDCNRWLAQRMAHFLAGEPASVYRAFDRGVDRIVNATGFDAASVEAWILTDTPPILPSVRGREQTIKGKLLDDTWIRRRVATITVHAPVTQQEMRRIWQRINHFFEGARPGIPRRTRSKGLNDLDAHVLRLFPTRDDGRSWEDRLTEWKATPPEGILPATWQQRQKNATPQALRKRWERAQMKLVKGGGKVVPPLEGKED